MPEAIDGEDCVLSRFGGFIFQRYLLGPRLRVCELGEGDLERSEG